MKNVIDKSHHQVPSPFKTKHTLERNMKKEHAYLREKNINSIAMAQKSSALSECCITSLTSSGIGSMKSSTVSVTTGSPTPTHFISGTLDTAVRPETCPYNTIEATGICSSKQLGHSQHMPEDSLEAKKTTISSNSDDMFNLTDVEDVDTSGIFSISETTPLKRNKVNSSQMSLEKEFIIPENILENDRVKSKRGNSANILSQIHNDSEKLEEQAYVPCLGKYDKAAQPHVIDEIDEIIEPIYQVIVENSSNSTVSKRERLSSESKTRRQGKFK